MKEEALNLADELLRDNTQLTVKSAYMIRRLVEELDKQEYRRTHEGFSTIIDKVTPQLKPLSDEEITLLWHKSMNLAISEQNLNNNISHATIFAKAIEERHGIK